MEGMFEGTGIKALYLYQDLQIALKKRMVNFDVSDLHKYYAQAQGKDDKTVPIASISQQIGRKPRTHTNTTPL